MSLLVRSKVRAVFLSLVAGVGCDSLTESAAPSPHDGAKPVLATGRYALSTEFDLRTLPDWPAAVDAAVTPLEDLSDHPSTAILGDSLKDKIPDPLAGKFREWFNAEVLHGKLDLAKLEDGIKEMFGHFRVTSTIDLAGTTATHQLTGVEFDFGAQHVAVALEQPAETAPLEGATIGLHRFALPLGDVGGGMLDENGLRSVIAGIVDCSRIAARVSKKCDGEHCVEHAADIANACQAGVDALAGVLLVALKKLDVQNWNLAARDIDVVDGSLVGVWSGSVDLGAGPRQLVSKFSAKKL